MTPQIPSTCDSLMAGRFSFGFWCWWALANLARCGRVCVLLIIIIKSTRPGRNQPRKGETTARAAETPAEAQPRLGFLRPELWFRRPRWVSVEASQKHPADVLLARQGHGLRGGAGGNGGNGGNEKPEERSVETINQRLSNVSTGPSTDDW